LRDHPDAIPDELFGRRSVSGTTLVETERTFGAGSGANDSTVFGAPAGARTASCADHSTGSTAAAKPK
jgi:hypothetical protein